MRHARFSLEEQVGGLVDHDDDGPARRRATRTETHLAEELPRYELRRGAPAIRADRASDAGSSRRVA